MKYVSVSKKVRITRTIWLVLFRYTIRSLLSKFIWDIRCHHNPSIMTSMWMFFCVCIPSQTSVQLLGPSYHLRGPLFLALLKEELDQTPRKQNMQVERVPCFPNFFAVFTMVAHRLLQVSQDASRRLSKLTARCCTFICLTHWAPRLRSSNTHIPCLQFSVATCLV